MEFFSEKKSLEEEIRRKSETDLTGPFSELVQESKSTINIRDRRGEIRNGVLLKCSFPGEFPFYRNHHQEIKFGVLACYTL